MNGATGPTGVARGYTSTDAPRGHQLFGATGPAAPFVTTIRDEEWYAFRLDGREFFARARMDFLTGFLELTEIPDPWVCVVCGKHYLEGPHEHLDPNLDPRLDDGQHDFQPRGDFTKEQP